MITDASSSLTTNGVHQLFHDSLDAADVYVQVLGVYRYLADPALKKRLGPTFKDARDVFDVLLSDGRQKMKAVLGLECNHLVWKHELRADCIIRVVKSKVSYEDPKDEKLQQRVVVLRKLAVVSLHNEGELPRKVLAQPSSTHENDDQLEFVTVAHPREVDLLPLVGERIYYLPVWSDHYTLDWACSCTDGVADHDSPLDELEPRWACRYGKSEAVDRSSGNVEATRSPIVAWNTKPEYCSDIFTPEYKKIFTILEVLEGIQQDKQDGSSNFHPPLLGAIRVKSQLMNLGDPDIANPFPFAFNAVVVDATGVFEVMFFGSMCAKYYLTLQEGDFIQFRGYSFLWPRELHWTITTSPLIYYGEGSSGSALHVLKKYWKLLVVTKVAPRLLKASDEMSSSPRQMCSRDNPQSRPLWLECNFVTTLNAQWDKTAVESLDMMYFDFVGVLSEVGKIFHGRKQKLKEKSFKMTYYRWIKMIDCSSSHELVIKLSECSQPVVFRSLKAGHTLMITKLQWIVLSSAESYDNQIQYAITSIFSVLRTNEAISPFYSIEECNLNSYFANNIRKKAGYISRKVTGESKLTAFVEKNYQPRNRLPTDVDKFREVFKLKDCSFEDLSELLKHMEAYEYQHVGFVGRVSAVIKDNESTKEKSPVLLQLRESKTVDQVLTVAITVNGLYRRPHIRKSVKNVTPSEAIDLVRLLPVDVVDDMYAKALDDVTTQSTQTTSPELSLSFIEDYLVRSSLDYFFSLQLYRDGTACVTWEVDAILAIS